MMMMMIRRRRMVMAKEGKAYRHSPTYAKVTYMKVRRK
jgi:hypothetical protein